MEKPSTQELTELTDRELIDLRIMVEVELGRRGISFNVGEIGESICLKYFNSTAGLPNLLQAPKGAKNVDALSRDGDRYSIKTFMKAKKTGTIYPDTGDENKQLFEYLVIVRLSKYYSSEAIYRFSWKQFVNLRCWDKRMNAWYVPLSKKNLAVAEIIQNES